MEQKANFSRLLWPSVINIVRRIFFVWIWGLSGISSLSLSQGTQQTWIFSSEWSPVSWAGNGLGFTFDALQFFFFFLCLFVFVGVFIGCTHSIWEFPSQGLILSHSCKLQHSCSNARSFNPLCQAGDCTRTSVVSFLTHCATLGIPAL